MRIVALAPLIGGCLWIGAGKHDERKASMTIELEVVDINPDAWSLCEGDVPNFAVAGSVAGRHEGQKFDAWYELEGDVRRQAGTVTADPQGEGRSTVTFQVELDDAGSVVTDCTSTCPISMKVGLSRLGLDDEADAEITIVAAADPEVVSSRFAGPGGETSTAGVALTDNPVDSVDPLLYSDVIIEVADPHQSLGLGGDGTVRACPVGLDPITDAASCASSDAESIDGTDGDGAFSAPLAALGDEACDPANVDVRYALFLVIEDHACGASYVLPIDAPPLRIVVDDCDGDGATVADGDCADDDPLRGPTNKEVWYDGVDSDCSGGSDFDQDGDGADSDQYKGDDCDDLDPGRYPGAFESCDGRDNDCDDLELTQKVTLFAGTGPLNYDTIDDAVGNASDGDEIGICEGVFVESVTVDASITIRGTTGTAAQVVIQPPAGAGITIDAGNHDVVLEGLRVEGGSGIDGGGLDGLGANSLVITDCEFVGNTATRGGAMRVQGDVTLDAVLIENNQADDGGGIYAESGTVLDINGQTSITNNRAFGSGGGLYATDGVMTFSPMTTFDLNTATLGGGAALVDSGDLDGGRFESNGAPEGAGIALVEDAAAGPFVLADATLADHSDNGNVRGGGVHAVGDAMDVELDGLTLARNYASASGGGVYLEGTSNALIAVLDSNLFEENDAGGSGGGLYAANTEIELDGETFELNTANDGAGMWLGDTVADFRATDFTDNDANNQGGGLFGLRLDLTARGTDFDTNLAGRGGGALLEESTCEFTNGSWTDNDASFFGGAISVTNGSEVTWTGTLSASTNTATGGEAGWIESGGVLYGCDTVDVQGVIQGENYVGPDFDPSGYGCFEVNDSSYLTGDCTILPPC